MAPHQRASLEMGSLGVLAGRWFVKACRILIADDHELVRRGVRALVEAQPG